MDCLYKTSAKNTFGEYKKFSKRIMLSKGTIIVYALLTAFLIFDGIVTESMYFIVFVILYPAVVWLIYVIQTRKWFKTNKVFQNTTAEYEFFATYFTETDLYGTTRIEYSKLHKIIETKTNFYLMIAKNQGLILCKENFPEGLNQFLRSIKIS